MNILITHVYSRDNKGDAAILSVQIQQLKKLYPKAKITISTLENTDNFSDYEGCSVIPSFFYLAIYTQNNPILRILNTCYILLSTTIWAVWYRQFKQELNWLLSPAVKQIVRAYQKADLITPVGGGYLSGKAGLQSTIALVLLLHAIAIGEILGKINILYSQTIGPFHNQFQAMMTRSVLNHANFILVRENESLKALDEIGVNDSLVFRTVDAGFLFETNQQQFMKKELGKYLMLNKKPVVGVTVRRWLNKQQQYAYELAIASLVDYLTSKQKMSVVFIPQVTSVQHNDDDRQIANRIKRKLINTSDVVFLNERYDHYQIKGLYSNLDYLVGTRMHSVIFALTEMVPCLAIEYEYKTRGIMKDLELDEYVIKIEDATAEKLVKLFEEIKANKKDYVTKLEKALPSYIQSAEETTRLFQNLAY